MDGACEHLNNIEILVVWGISIVVSNVMCWYCSRRHRNSNYNRI